MTRSIEVGRLRRALHLEAVPAGRGSWRVLGGSAEHVVVTDAAGLTTCDCFDAQGRGVVCKHQLGVQLLALPEDVRVALRELVPAEKRRRVSRKAPY